MKRFRVSPFPYADIYTRPLVPLLIALSAGLVTGVHLPGYSLWIYPFVCFAAVSVMVHVFIKQPARFSPLILFICLGYLSIQPFTAPIHPADHVAHYLDGRKWRITGIVDQEPVIRNNRMQCVLDVVLLDAENTRHGVVGKIKVTIPGSELPTLDKGDKITFASRIRSIRNFHNPGAFNYERYMAFKEISGSAYAQADQLVILKKNPGSLPVRLISGYRSDLSHLINTTLPGDPGKILNALIIGKRSEVDSHLADQFNRAGLGHLLAISGLHVGIVASVAFLAFTWLLSRFDFFLRHAWTRKGAALLSVLPVLLYGVLAGMSPSTQRAVLMVGVFLMTFLIGREQDSLNTLAVAALVILIISPHALFSISFQLSFTAVFFIIYGLPKPENIAVSRETLWPAFRLKFFQFLRVSVLAIVGTLPLIMYYFNQISFAGFFSNLIGIPVIGFFVVPLGILSAFIYPISPFLASAGINTCGMVLKPVLIFINTIADLPFSAVKTMTPNLFEMGCIYLLLWSVLTFFKKRKDPQHTAYAISRFLLILCTATLLCDAGYHVYQRYGRKDLRITMLDVGQGNAALLELPGGYTMLIDGGGFSDNAIFDIGERLVAPFLWRKKIMTVDTIVLTHPNSDHYNGLTYIAEHFHVRQVWSNHESSETRSFDALMQAIRKNHVAFPAYESIPRHQEISGVVFDILHPEVDFMEHKWMDSNNNSFVVKVTFGKTTFLFPGDIMAQGERSLVRRSEEILKSSVLLAPHHGSRTSSTDQFLNAVQPGIIVISCGWKNKFHMPHKTVLSGYEKRGVRILRTDHHGAVTLISDGQHLTVDHVVDAESSSGGSYPAGSGPIPGQDR